MCGTVTHYDRTIIQEAGKPHESNDSMYFSGTTWLLLFVTILIE